MPAMHTVLRAPIALAYWLGALGGKSGESGQAAIFLYHGTPRHIAKHLERQLRYLRRAFHFVPLAAISASMSGCRPKRQRREAALIFDDGLRSNVAVAYPMLCRLRIPATFFVCPGLIEGGQWLWTHETRRRLGFAGPHLRAELANELGAPADAAAFVQWMKRLEHPARLRVQATVRQATARFVPTESDREEFDLAEWRELRALDPEVVTIGSHSMTHSILPRMSDSEIDSELRVSRCMIESKLGRSAELFSYPNGDVDGRTLTAVRRYYRGAVAHHSGMLRDPHMLPSMHLPRGVLRLAWQVNRQAAPTTEIARPRFAAAS